jgi:hypothetical protein
MDRLDPVLFTQQVATFAQLTAELMRADLATIGSARVDGTEALKLVHPD